MDSKEIFSGKLGWIILALIIATAIGFVSHVIVLA